MRGFPAEVLQAVGMGQFQAVLDCRVFGIVAFYPIQIGSAILSHHDNKSVPVISKCLLEPEAVLSWIWCVKKGSMFSCVSG